MEIQTSEARGVITVSIPKTPLPTLDQFRRAHESRWMRPCDLAAYEHKIAIRARRG